jgi:hypothetical protein
LFTFPTGLLILGLAERLFGVGAIPYISTTGISVLMTWIYVNANGSFFVAGFIPHATNNLMYVTGAFVGVNIQALVMTTIAALIISIAGTGLKGWRFSKSARANP